MLGLSRICLCSASLSHVSAAQHSDLGTAVTDVTPLPTAQTPSTLPLPATSGTTTRLVMDPVRMTPPTLTVGLDILSDSIHGHFFPVLHGHFITNSDSVDQFLRPQIQGWLAAFEKAPAQVAGVRLLDLASLYLFDQRDSAAQQCIRTWLATPNLTHHDIVWSYGVAIKLFVRGRGDSATSPARLAVAKSYLATLEAMPRDSLVDAAVFFGRWDIADAAKRAGDISDAVRMGLHAYAIVPNVSSYSERAALAASFELVGLGMMLAGQPRGRLILDSLIAVLRTAVKPPPEVLRRPLDARFAEDCKRWLEGNVAQLDRIGKPMVPLLATHWFNQSPPSTPMDTVTHARRRPLDDGVIRLIDFGYMGCPSCIAKQKYWETAQHALPKGVEYHYYLWGGTPGYWGADPVDPDIEAEHLKQFYLTSKHFTFPFEVWCAPKAPTVEGGLVSLPSPTLQDLGIATSGLIVVDGRGIIRYMGGGGRGDVVLWRVIAQLVAERSKDRSQQ